MKLRAWIARAFYSLALLAAVGFVLLLAGGYYVLVVLAHDGRTPFNTSETRMIGVERYKADAP